MGEPNPPCGLNPTYNMRKGSETDRAFLNLTGFQCAGLNHSPCIMRARLFLTNFKLTRSPTNELISDYPSGKRTTRTGLVDRRSTRRVVLPIMASASVP